MAVEKRPDNTNVPPFETDDLRKNLVTFLDSDFQDPATGEIRKVGNYKWGVYIFYDYDGEPIYVGQTNELLRTRIRRHLTNPRTVAFELSFLDPFVFFEIEVYPLPKFQNVSSKPDKEAAKAHLNALEHAVYEKAVAASEFKAILNEKDPPPPTVTITIPTPFRMRIVSEEVAKIRSHPDFRIARRSLIISRLAQVISERKVQGGLRRVLLTQAKRLQWLADRRYQALGGAASVVQETGDEGDNE